MMGEAGSWWAHVVRAPKVLGPHSPSVRERGRKELGEARKVFTLGHTLLPDIQALALKAHRLSKEIFYI